MSINNGFRPAPECNQMTDMKAMDLLANIYESAASLRVLIYFARTPGSLSQSDLASLNEAWDKLKLPKTITVASLLSEIIDLNLQLSMIATEEGRERTYTAAYLFANSMGTCSKPQLDLLHTIRLTLQISDKKATPLNRIYSEVRQLAHPTVSQFIADPVIRSQKVDEDILKFAMRNAVTGAFPVLVPNIIASGVIIFSRQAAMVGELGQYWGFVIDRQSATLLMASIQGGSGMRIAIQSLVRETSTLDSSFDSTSAFVTTCALGNVANKHFQSALKMDAEALRKIYPEMMEAARLAFKQHQSSVASAIQSRAITLELLNEELLCGNSTPEVFARKVLALE